MDDRRQICKKAKPSKCRLRPPEFVIWNYAIPCEKYPDLLNFIGNKCFHCTYITINDQLKPFQFSTWGSQLQHISETHFEHGLRPCPRCWNACFPTEIQDGDYILVKHAFVKQWIDPVKAPENSFLTILEPFMRQFVGRTIYCAPGCDFTDGEWRDFLWKKCLKCQQTFATEEIQADHVKTCNPRCSACPRCKNPIMPTYMGISRIHGLKISAVYYQVGQQAPEMPPPEWVLVNLAIPCVPQIHQHEDLMSFIRQKCFRCSARFSELKDLFEHISDYHTRMATCPRCWNAVENASDFHHLRIKPKFVLKWLDPIEIPDNYIIIPLEPFMREFIGRTFFCDTKSAYSEEMKNFLHTKCFKCKKVFPSVLLQEDHVKTCHPRCSACPACRNPIMQTSVGNCCQHGFEIHGEFYLVGQQSRPMVVEDKLRGKVKIEEVEDVLCGQRRLERGKGKIEEVEDVLCGQRRLERGKGKIEQGSLKRIKRGEP